jgi:hypothetical protein
MNDRAKISLSPTEMGLVTRGDWILTKREILDKVAAMLGIVSDSYKKILLEEKEIIHHLDINTRGKISKGENYLGLPYMILDQPATFNSNEIFAIRSMFWWGNFFSITLHIAGKNFLSKIDLTKFPALLQRNKFMLCVNTDQWQHHFRKDNYVSFADEADIESFNPRKKNFLKIARKYPVEEWDSIPAYLQEDFINLIGIIKTVLKKDQFPNL